MSSEFRADCSVLVGIFLKFEGVLLMDYSLMHWVQRRGLGYWYQLIRLSIPHIKSLRNRLIQKWLRILPSLLIKRLLPSACWFLRMRFLSLVLWHNLLQKLLRNVSPILIISRIASILLLQPLIILANHTIIILHNLTILIARRLEITHTCHSHCILST